MNVNQQTRIKSAPDLMSARATGMLQRQCACGTHTAAGGECESCQKEKAAINMQRIAVNSAAINEVPQIVHEVLRSTGQSLDMATRDFMEPRFGHDFSNVRLHTDAKAAGSARAVNALAYTVGRNVVFGVGQYAPSTAAGQRLLAHELTHVVQQCFGKSEASVRPPSNNGDHEKEANKIATDLITNPSKRLTPNVSTGNVLAREEDPDAIPQIERSFELDPSMFIKRLDAPAEREGFSCPTGFKDLGPFRLTAYVLAQEKDFPETPTVTDPCGLKGTFRKEFLFRKDKPPRGVRTQGSGVSLADNVIHYKGNNCFEVLPCPKTKSGTCAASGRTVAVDTSVIRLGSELIIEGVGTRIAEDTGQQIVGNHIDIFYGTDLSVAEAEQKTLKDKKVCRKLIKETPKKAKK